MSKDTKITGGTLVDPSIDSSAKAISNEAKNSGFRQRLENHLAHRIRLGGSITYVDDDGNHVLEDQDGVRAYAPGETFPPAPDSAELEIRELAFLNHIHSDKTELDSWCEAITANAGDDVQSDEVEQLIIGLRRSGAVDGVELTKLHGRYLEELLQKQ